MPAPSLIATENLKESAHRKVLFTSLCKENNPRFLTFKSTTERFLTSRFIRPEKSNLSDPSPARQLRLRLHLLPITPKPMQIFRRPQLDTAGSHPKRTAHSVFVERDYLEPQQFLDPISYE